METIKFSKQISYDGETITEVNLDFDALTGQDLINAEREYMMGNKTPAPVKEFDKGYLVIVAAKAANVPSDMFLLLGAKDFTKITIKTQNFLLNEE